MMRRTTRLTAALLLLAAAAPARKPGQPTVWLIGDSTVHNGGKPEVGWGDVIGTLFDPDKVRVVNRAVAGRSARSFQAEGKWDATLKEVEHGDYVIMQFGHNDGGTLVDPKTPSRSRGDLPGLGEETKDVTHPDGHTETIHTFGWYMRKFVTDTRDKGATPIICSWIPHCPKPGDKMDPDPAPSSYRKEAADIAAAGKVPYIDLYALTWKHYAPMTPEAIKTTYFTAADNTHTNAAGAALNAASVAEGLRSLKDVPLAADLKPVAPSTQP